MALRLILCAMFCLPLFSMLLPLLPLVVFFLLVEKTLTRYGLTTPGIMFIIRLGVLILLGVLIVGLTPSTSPF